MISKIDPLDPNNGIITYNSQISTQDTKLLNRLMYYKTIFNR